MNRLTGYDCATDHADGHNDAEVTTSLDLIGEVKKFHNYVLVLKAPVFMYALSVLQ